MKVNPYENQELLPFVIAEIGINHNGSVDIAKKLIDMAKDCGADAVKFQKRTIDIVYTKELLDSPRQSPWGATQRAQKEGLEFGKDQYDEIDRYCRTKGIYWFASAWDEKSQEFLRQYDLPFNKIASTMLTHKNLVEMVADAVASAKEQLADGQLPHIGVGACAPGDSRNSRARPRVGR